ncbi:SDH family Clp fold serine proteinase [Agrobacterium rubi]|uniref:SDH family Clp fold serine proteinase n=1 Tax=Agrobacterium rubi TaxID=28099 RepID=UPI001F2737EC|nr:hypothetical protein [Agrobacterium rubi]
MGTGVLLDIYLYNGEIKRSADLRFIEMVNSEKQHDDCLLIMVTPGGDPDAAYKMSRYLQHRYNSYKVLIAGYCKSAGTLFAIGADEVIFTPYGELGPLDVQMEKMDKVTSLESGLNITEAFVTLEDRARQTYQNVITDILSSSGGIVSFQTASHAATEIVTALYGPIFGRIDPEEVGSRSRAMRIGEDYSHRLAEKWNNLKPEAVSTLSQTYSSHGFVIDYVEAQSLFNNVRLATKEEMDLVIELGAVARHPKRNSLTMKKLRDIGASNQESEDNEQDTEQSPAKDRELGEADGLNSEATGGAEGSAPL